MPEDKQPDFSKMSDADLEKFVGAGSLDALNPAGKRPPTNPGEGRDISELSGYLTQNLPMGAVNGIAGGLTGGPLGAVAGAASGFFSPPDNASQALQNAASFMLPKAAQATEGLMSRFTSNPAMHAAAQGLMGAGYDQTVNRALDALGGGGSTPTGLSSTASFLVPAAMGYFYQMSRTGPTALRTKLEGNIQKTLDDITSGGIQIGRDPVAQAGQASGGFAPTYQHLQDQYQQSAQQAKITPQMEKHVADLTKQRADLLTQVRFADDQSENWTNAQLAGNKRQIEQIVGKPQVMAQPDAQGRLQMGVVHGNNKSAATFMPMSDPEAQAYNTATNKLSQLKDGINPDTGTTFDKGDKALKLYTKEQQDNIENVLGKVTQRKLDMLTKQSEEQAKNTLAGIQGQVSNIDEQTRGLNDIITSLKKAVANDPLENVNLKGMVGPGTDTNTLTQYLAKSATAQDIEQLYKHLGKQPGGAEMIKKVQSAMVSDFFMKAYQPGQAGYPNARKLFSGDGMNGSSYYQTKLAAIYGGGTEGEEKAGKFAQMVMDLTQLSSMQKQATTTVQAISKLGRASLVALPTTVALHTVGVPWHIAAPASEATMVGLMSLPKLADSIVNKPYVAEALHNMVTKGGSAQAQAVLTKYFHDNGQKF